jgi:hypothetical protein
MAENEITGVNLSQASFRKGTPNQRNLCGQ